MIIPPGSTSQSITIQIVDDLGLPVTGLIASTFPATSYERVGEALFGISLSNLDALDSAYSSGGVKEVGSGYYRLCVPDEAFVSKSQVSIIGEETNKRIIAPVINCHDQLVNQVPGTYPPGSAGAALGRIGVANLTVVSPIGVNSFLTLTKGDDYLASDNRALDWVNVSGTWPNLTGATITLVVNDGTMSSAGTVVVPTGPNQHVRAEPTQLETDLLSAGQFDYQVKASLPGGRVVTLVQSFCKVVDNEAN